MIGNDVNTRLHLPVDNGLLDASIRWHDDAQYEK